MTKEDDKRKARTYLNNKWDSNNTRRITCKFMLKSDADILKQLDKQDNKTDYIRRLIRADLEGRVLPK
jgi:hypothetical protein